MADSGRAGRAAEAGGGEVDSGGRLLFIGALYRQQAINETPKSVISICIMFQFRRKQQCKYALWQKKHL